MFSKTQRLLGLTNCSYPFRRGKQFSRDTYIHKKEHSEQTNAKKIKASAARPESIFHSYPQNSWDLTSVPVSKRPTLSATKVDLKFNSFHKHFSKKVPQDTEFDKLPQKFVFRSMPNGD